MGDVNNDSIYDIWHGDSFTSLREAFTKQTALMKYSACNYCSDNVVTEKRVVDVGDKKINVAKYKGIEDIVVGGGVVTQKGRREKSQTF
jgi:hypothetical protein